MSLRRSSTGLSRPLCVENLESRELLAFDAFAQLSLELINRARMNPAAEMARNSQVSNLNSGLAAGTISTAAKQPLAPHDLLEEAAERHNVDMRDSNRFSHTGSDGSTAGSRLSATGYTAIARAENLAAVPYFHATLNNIVPNTSLPDGTSPTNLAAAVQDMHDTLFASSGHRRNMMNPIYREIGIHAQEFLGPYVSLPALTVATSTEVYGTRNNQPILTGVVINDADGDDFYDVGEGMSGVVIAAYQSGSLIAQTTSISTGGYGLGLDAGTYEIRVTGSGVSRVRSITLGTDNVKEDFEAGSDPGGTFRGTVFADADENGNASGDARLPGVTVFLDANGNGLREGSETSTVTNASGAYELTTPVAGTYTVAVESSFGYRTSAGGVASYTSTISVGQTISGRDFARFQDVQLTGSTVRVFGTSGADNITYTASTTHQFNVNGISYSVAPATYNNIEIGGASGNDSIFIQANDGNDTITIDPGTVALNGVTTVAGGIAHNYNLSATSFSDVDVDLGDGTLDKATLNDGAGDDDLFAHPTTGRLKGAGYDHFVEGFDELYAFGNRGGNDRAYVYDGLSNDHYVGRKEFSVLKGANLEFFVRMEGFERNFSYSENGGTDYAFFYDSPGDDNFFGRTDYAVMQDPAVSYFNYAKGFSRAFGYATQGGFDQAFLTASDGDDRYFGKENLASLRGANFEYFNQAEQFERTYAYGGQGGNDIASYYGSAGNDRYTAYATSSVWRGASDEFYHTVNQFDENIVFASEGGTDQATLFDDVGNDFFFGRDDDSFLSRPGYITRLINVEEVTIHGVNGPSNTLNVDSLDYVLSINGIWV